MNPILTGLLWIVYLLSLYIAIYWVIIFAKDRFMIKKEKIIELKNYPLVSVIIPAYNEESTIIPSIQSVINLEYPKEKIEIIVVNDGSKDRTKEVIQKFMKKQKESKIQLLNQENQGKAAALNHALKDVKGDFFACLDADSFVDKDTLKKMLRRYEKGSKRLSIVTPAMKVKSPKTFTQKLQSIEYLVSLFIVRLMSTIDCIYVAPGPFSLYRTNTIKKLGGFDTTSLTEDQEIAYRVQKHHYDIKQCYDGYVYTIAPKTPRGLYKQRNRWVKGSIYSMIKYKEIIFNRKYGDFGLMQMSINLLVFGLAIAGIFFFGIYILWPILEMIRNLYLINFDIAPYFKGLITMDFDIWKLDVQNSLTFAFIIIITLVTIFLAHKNAREKIKLRNSFILLIYLFIYYLAMSFIVIMVLFEMLIDRHHTWKEKV